MDLIKIAKEAFATDVKREMEFHPGDTITVAYKIIEGTKERIQMYRGVVIRISGHGNEKRFTVRKMSGTVGVERIFPLNSPAIDSITVNKRGRVRRAKLYYLRALTGKKARIKEIKAYALSTIFKNKKCSPQGCIFYFSHYFSGIEFSSITLRAVASCSSSTATRTSPAVEE